MDSEQGFKIQKKLLIKIVIGICFLGTMIMLFFAHSTYDKAKKSRKQEHFVTKILIPDFSYYVRQLPDGLMVYLEARYYGLNNLDVTFTTDKWKTQKKIQFKKIEQDNQGQIWRVNLGKFNINEKVKFYFDGYKKNGDIVNWGKEDLGYQIFFKKKGNKIEIFDTLSKKKETIRIHYTFPTNGISSKNDTARCTFIDLSTMISPSVKEAFIHFSDNIFKTYRKKPIFYSEEKGGWIADLGELKPGKEIEWYISIINRDGTEEYEDHGGVNYFFRTDRTSQKTKNSKKFEEVLIKEYKEELVKMPIRKEIGSVKEFKKNHPIIVSLTTSPKRISKVKHVIDTLDLEFVDEVIIAIPELFGRTESSYVIPFDLEGYRGKTKILRIKKDLGPITKLLPAVEYLRQKPNGQNGIVITVDDDIGYPAGFIRELILTISTQEKMAASVSVASLNFWNIGNFGFPAQLNGMIYPVNSLIAEGFGGIAYRVKDIDTELMQFLLQENDFKECVFSDDLLISFVLAYSGVDRRHVFNEYVSTKFLRLFPYGLEEDALHYGAGLLEESVNHDINDEKYKKCYNKLVNIFMGFDLLKLKGREEILNQSRMRD